MFATAHRRICSIWDVSRQGLTVRDSSRSATAISVVCRAPITRECTRATSHATGQFVRRPCRRKTNLFSSRDIYFSRKFFPFGSCKHAMISVSQENSHKSLVKRSIASLNKTARTVRAWSGNQKHFKQLTLSIRMCPLKVVDITLITLITNSCFFFLPSHTPFRVDCTGERDHLIFYDGSSTNDPVLAKFCGGDWLPKVVSR